MKKNLRIPFWTGASAALTALLLTPTVGARDLCGTFGTSDPEDIPISGDWDGDGRDEIGTFSRGTWSLDTNRDRHWNGTAGGDELHVFGQSGDLPVVGDWNGDGIDDFGLRRVHEGRFLLDSNGDRQLDCAVDACFEFFNTRDRRTPLSGDWDADGRDEVGVHWGNGWIFDLNENGAWDGSPPDDSAIYGLEGDIPLSGDWNGDGRDELGVFRSGGWSLDANNDRVYAGTSGGDLGYYTGPETSTYRPVILDWNGDSRDRIATYHLGAWWIDDNGNGAIDGCESNSINRPPVAGNDSVLVGDAPVLVSVLANDSDPDGDPLTLVELGKQPRFGQASMEGSKIRFEPAGQLPGISGLPYEVSDGRGGSTTGLLIFYPKAPFYPEDSTFELVAVQSGDWNDPATWNRSRVPADGDDVDIPLDFTVTVRHQEPARLSYVRVRGELRMAVDRNTRLLVDTLYVGHLGTFRIGFPNNPVRAGRTAELVFINDSASGSGGTWNFEWDPAQISRGLISDGTLRLYGEPKRHMIPMTADARSGSDLLQLDESAITAAADWQPGDELVIPGTYFQRVRAPQHSSQDERIAIAGFEGNGSRVRLARSLSFDHVRPDDGLSLHVVNLTRNIVVRSESTAQLRDRGHVMTRSPNVDIRHVRFEGVGRTHKAEPLDDIQVIRVGSGETSDYDLEVPAPHEVTNPRGRYALHFHRNSVQATAASPPSKVYGSVVIDTAGWGFVNHSSHVDFQRNIAYDFVGAGFVTESGDELGNFFDNVAIRGRGEGIYRPRRLIIRPRLAFGNLMRPQPLSDFGFSGDGFWFQGPAIRVRNNVASGCNGTGMMWFTTGAPNIQDRFETPEGLTHNRYVHFRRDHLAGSAAYGSSAQSLNPRYWDFSETNERLVIADLPILEMDGFDSYGNLFGFRLRFNNHPSNDWYEDDDKIHAYNYDEHIVTVCLQDPTCASRNRQTVKNLRLWNNETGLHSAYVSRTDWENVEILNRLAYSDPIANDPFVGYTGAVFNFQVRSITFTDLDVDGYPIAGWNQRTTTEASMQTDFLTPRVYRNFASAERWLQDDMGFKTCDGPTSLNHSFVTSTTARISWNPGAANARFLLRYRAAGDPHWQMASGTSSPMNLAGLEPDTSYTYQVVAGCVAGTQEEAMSHWSATRTFSTSP